MDKENFNEKKPSRIKIPEFREQIKSSAESIIEIEKHLQEAVSFLKEEIENLEFYEEYLQHMKDYNEFANQPIKENERILLDINSKKYSEDQFTNIKNKIEKARSEVKAMHDTISSMTLYKTRFQVLIDEFFGLENQFNGLLTHIESSRNN
jgi:hypothetical protein